MAITFDSIPNNYSPSDNPLNYVFSSDQTGQDNFSFKVETLLDGSVVSEDRVYPERANYAHFDVSPVVINLIPSPTITTAFATELDSKGLISLRVTELYGDPPTDQATLTSSETYTFKCSLSPKEWEQTDFTTYLNTRFLTDVPNNLIKVIRGQDVLTAMLADTTLSLTVDFYDSSGVLLDTFVSPVALPYIFLQLNLSVTNMQSIYGGASYNDVSYFDITVNTSETLRILYVDNYCFEAHALIWMNKYGTYDQYPILHNVTEKSNIESRSYKKKYGQWDGTNYVYSNLDSGDVDFEKIIEDSGSFVTDYMTAETQNWLVSCYDSTEAYLYDTTGIQFRASLTGRTYDKKQTRFDDLIMEEITYKDVNSRKSVKT